MQRKLVFYTTCENEIFLLHVLDIRRIDETQTRTQRVLSDDSLDFSELMHSQLMRFNNLDVRSNRQFYSSFLNNNARFEKFRDGYHANTTLTMHKTDFNLQRGQKELLMFLGTLDNALHSAEHTWKQMNLAYTTTFCETPPDLSDLPKFCSQAFETVPPKKARTYLSRYVADALVYQLDAAKDDQPEGIATLIGLRELLAVTKESLTPVIRQRLYPAKPVESMLMEVKYAQADELMKALLNDTDSHETKLDKLLKYVRGMLAKKASFKGIDANNPESASVAIAAKEIIHGELTNWFKIFENTRDHLWLDIIHSRLIGKAAPDNGFYSTNYTEIYLLKQAKFRMMPNGLMELLFLNTNAYKNHYAENCLNFAVLQEELEAIFGYLDLHFLPNQNFHERAVFDQDSSNTLKNWGFHLSELLCKESLLSENVFKVLHGTKAETESPLKCLNKKYFLQAGFFVNRALEYEKQKRIEEENKKAMESGELLTLDMSGELLTLDMGF